MAPYQRAIPGNYFVLPRILRTARSEQRPLAPSAPMNLFLLKADPVRMAGWSTLR
jgi:hypothetical protein